jgi:hypothetical protein
VFLARTCTGGRSGGAVPGDVAHHRTRRSHDHADHGTAGFTAGRTSEALLPPVPQIGGTPDWPLPCNLTSRGPSLVIARRALEGHFFPRRWGTD